MPLPPFARGRRWRKRASQARRYVNRRVWYDPDTGYEYEKDPTPQKGTYHEIDPRQGRYREIDRETGEPVAGGEGEWRPLR
jgi:hypothetical protein